MGREVVVPSPGSRRNVDIWKPSQMESFLPTPVERLLNGQQGHSHHLPRWRREDTSGTARQSMYCCCPSQICLTALLRRTRQWFNVPALQGSIFIFPTQLTPASAVSCNLLFVKGRGRTSSNLESSTGQGLHLTPGQGWPLGVLLMQRLLLVLCLCFFAD